MSYKIARRVMWEDRLDAIIGIALFSVALISLVCLTALVVTGTYLILRNAL